MHVLLCTPEPMRKQSKTEGHSVNGWSRAFADLHKHGLSCFQFCTRSMVYFGYPKYVVQRKLMAFRNSVASNFASHAFHINK